MLPKLYDNYAAGRNWCAGFWSRRRGAGVRIRVRDQKDRWSAVEFLVDAVRGLLRREDGWLSDEDGIDGRSSAVPAHDDGRTSRDFLLDALYERERFI